jgi:hypothetical protein
MSDPRDTPHEPEPHQYKEYQDFPDRDDDDLAPGDDPEYHRMRLPGQRKQPRRPLPRRPRYED